MPDDDMTDRHTILSDDRAYRYVLWREWGMLNHHYACFIGLNGSTADETHDDPTIRRCVGFTKAWGFGALAMVNLFAFRTLDPKVLKAQSDPVGIANDSFLVDVTARAGIVIAAWGVHGTHRGRDREVVRLLTGPNNPKPAALYCLGHTKDGHPKHPLYLPKTTVPHIYQGGIVCPTT